MEKRKDPGPIGTPAAAAAARRAASSPEYRAQRVALEPYREIAWLLVQHRMKHGLTQQQLAELVGTSNAQISRIESGQQRTTVETLARIAHALGMRMIVGFRAEADDDTAAQLIAI